MRALAGQLRFAAGMLGDACSNVDGCVSGMTFIGPAGDRFRARMQSADGDIRDAGARLQDVARRLDRSADEVDAAQRAHDRALAELAIEQHQHGLNPAGAI
jgi:outer membrane murein-binding lipoprotein Lpp